MKDRDLMPEDGAVQPGEPVESEDGQSVVTPPFPMSEQDLIDPSDPDDYVDTESEGAEDQAYYAPTSTRRRQRYSPPPPEPTGRGYACADVITAIFLLMTIAVCAVTVLLYANPQSPLNPFPPPTYPSIMVIATALPTDTPTMTFTPLPFTATPLPTSTSTNTATATETWTPTVTATPVVGGGAGPTATQTLSLVILSTPSPQFTLSPFPFTVEPGRYTANKSPDACNWQSIAGSVNDLAGKPIKGLAIRVTGSNGNIDEVHYTGTEPRFGESGFEVFLGAIPRQDQYTVQLLGRTGSPISDTVTVQTHTGCTENVVIVNFVQNHSY